MEINVEDDAQSVVNGHPPGTTYIVKAGIHLRNFSVQPKSGDTFCGEPGAVLDGGRSLASAFSGGASNVTLDSITVRDYESGRQGAAIQPESRASGWVVRNVSALHNAWAGLLVADGMQDPRRSLQRQRPAGDRRQRGHRDRPGRAGRRSGHPGRPGAGPQPHAPRPLRVRGRGHEVGCRAGHRSATLTSTTTTAGGSGPTSTPTTRSSKTTWSRATRRRGSSTRSARTRSSATIGSTATDVRAAGWYWDGGITVASSSNVEVYGNRLSGNYNGITGTQQDRPDSTPPAHLLDRLPRPRQHDLRHRRRGAPHGRGGRQRRRPRHPGHQFHRQHHPVGSLRVTRVGTAQLTQPGVHDPTSRARCSAATAPGSWPRVPIRICAQVNPNARPRVVGTSATCRCAAAPDHFGRSGSGCAARA